MSQVAYVGSGNKLHRQNKGHWSLEKRKAKKPWPVAWLEQHPVHQKAVGWVPGLGAYLGCGLHPWSVPVQEAASRCFSLILMFLPLSQINKNISLGEGLKIKVVFKRKGGREEERKEKERKRERKERKEGRKRKRKATETLLGEGGVYRHRPTSERERAL